MATATANNHSLQHPSHQHPLEIQGEGSGDKTCDLCRKQFWPGFRYYRCREGCESYYHKECVEAPPRIDPHPLHTEHPLILTHDDRLFTCDQCNRHRDPYSGSFRCDQCDFDLDRDCALSALPITLPIHPHPLAWFSKRYDLERNRRCYICRGDAFESVYTCMQESCKFFIHKACVHNLYYRDGNDAPTVYHGHYMMIYGGFETCASCGSDEWGEFIGCRSCRVFYHRQCFQVPEIITYPSHHPDHTLILFSEIGLLRVCESCSCSLRNQVCYRCTSCDFFVHIECASKVLAYVEEEGMSARIELSWHNHTLFLCHGTESAEYRCKYCEDDSIGPTYVCKDNECEFALHKRCSEVASTITHPHHPDHPISLGKRDDDSSNYCLVCGKTLDDLMFSCKRCLVDLHVECSALFPTHKHHLHEHKLLRLERCQNGKCNRCSKSTDSPLFRCVPCNFNLHEECMELPRVVKSKIHWHPLTLQSIFLEDDSGEYYCEECEQTRDPRLGVYVCGHCQISIPRIYHIHCALPELAKIYETDTVLENLASDFKKLNEQIADKRDEVCVLKEKLEKATRELDVLVEQRAGLSGGNLDWKSFSESVSKDESGHRQT